MSTIKPSNFDASQFLKNTARSPGVYQMYDVEGKILYIGKARDLKNRLSSYFRNTGLSIKTRSLVSKIHDVQVTLTASETDALILEQNLIKEHKPPYNISLRDDKSYPYIFVSEHKYPRISSYRGIKRYKGQYFGPFPSAGAVNETLHFIEKTFKLRNCENSVFNNRSRPCLQYQIERCSAPCVDYISPEEYQRDIDHSIKFLQGESRALMAELADNMETAASNLDFEAAATLRDRITSLRRVQENFDKEQGTNKVDVFAVSKVSNKVCVHVVYIRQARIIGSKSYFSDDKLQYDKADLLNEFLAQFYIGHTNREIPHEIIVNHALVEHDKILLLDVLSTMAKRKLTIAHQVRSLRKQWLTLAETTAEQNLNQKIQSKKTSIQRFESLQEALHLATCPKRLECYDISHSSGEATVASCVVFDHSGPRKSDYRRFNISGITGGDDYAAMAQALTRRYKRVNNGEYDKPDLLIVDGGKGQLNKAIEVLHSLSIYDVQLIGIAKGTTRKAGFETLILPDGREKVLNSDSPALHLLQEIRDEAHRFAITGHKQRRDKKRRTSTLEDIPGVGAKRRRELLRHFGGLAQIKRASVTELEKVEGIHKKIAIDIYSALHNE